MNLCDPLFTWLSSLVVAVCFAGWILPHEERGTGGGTRSCASQVACIRGQHGSTGGLWAVSACRGGAGDRLCCFYWVREAAEESFPCSLPWESMQKDIPAEILVTKVGLMAEFMTGFSPAIWERGFCQSVRAQAHMEVTLLCSQHCAKVCWATRALVAVQYLAVLLNWSGLSLDSYLL